MGIFDMLRDTLSGRAAQAQQPDLGQLLQGLAPGGDLGKGLAAALGSDKGAHIGEFVSRLFAQSSAEQKAGLINQILGALGGGGGALLSGLAGGILGKVLAPGQSALTPDQAGRLSAQDAAAIASDAVQRNPDVLQQIARFYSQHSALVHSLGATVLAALAARAGGSGGPPKA